jgi:Flp pilus assembly protein TadD
MLPIATALNKNVKNTPFRRFALAAVSALALGLGGCAGPSSDLTAELLGTDHKPKPAPSEVAGTPQTELEKATGYWGEKFSKSPTSLENALSYARNLKAMGRKREALAVLQHASTYHAQDREFASEYGRLALELDQVQTAKSVLAFADDPAKPDWRVISARGAVMAKEGNNKDAIRMFERALVLSDRSPSVVNNLAMAYALDGRPADGERLLREAATKGNSEKVQKNLALVLGLQGKYDEARMVGSQVLDHATVAEDTDLVRKVVGLDPKPYNPPASATYVAEDTTLARPAVQRTATQPSSPLRESTHPAASSSWAPQVATRSN